MKIERITEIINFLPYKEHIISQSKSKDSAILIPIVEKDDKLHILFEKRSQFVSQPGEICFPGGRIDEGEDSKDAAVRETTEELGLNDPDINVLGKLGILPSTHRNNLHCYVGFIHWSAIEDKRYNQREVEEIMLVDLDVLVKTEPKSYKVRLEAQVVEVDEKGDSLELFPAKDMGLPEMYHEGWSMGYREITSYELENLTIWGLTGTILKDFLSYLD